MKKTAGLRTAIYIHFEGVCFLLKFFLKMSGLGFYIKEMLIYLLQLLFLQLLTDLEDDLSPP